MLCGVGKIFSETLMLQVNDWICCIVKFLVLCIEGYTDGVAYWLPHGPIVTINKGILQLTLHENVNSSTS